MAKTGREEDRPKLLQLAQAWLTLAGGDAAVVPADPILDFPPHSERH